MSRHFELMQMQIQAREPSFERQSDDPDAKRPREIGADGVMRSRGGVDGLDREALGLVQRIFLLPNQEPPRVVVFAGIEHRTGCSGICAAVAETLARNTPGPVCIVEANFRSPGLPNLFNTTNHFGLADALTRVGPIRSFAKPVMHEKVWLISSGALNADSAALITSARTKERIGELRTEFDFVIIDVPPVTRYPDALAVGQLADGVVLVLAAGSTRRESAQLATSTLRSSNVSILGAVLNKRTYPIPEPLYKRL